MNPFLQSILKMSYDFAAIDRDIYYPDRERPENDSEHSFELAFIAWNIIEADKLNLNMEKVLKLCLAHDLVEIYSGDVPLWGRDGHAEKEAREKKALEQLREKLKNAPGISNAITEYKGRTTDEAKFVYALDKLLPFLNQLNTEGRVWKAHNISIEKSLEVLDRHAKVCPHLLKYFEEGIEHMKENKKRFFGS